MDMKHIITDEEALRFRKMYVEGPEGMFDAYKAALTDFLNNRPQVAQLRPIAEMSEKVPEGHQRMGWKKEYGFRAAAAWKSDTHFIDVQLPTPDPDAEERRQFEEACEEIFELDDFLRNDRGYYHFEKVQTAWKFWKLAKKGGDK